MPSQQSSKALCAVILVTDCGTLGRNPPKRMGGGKGYKMRKLPSAVLDYEASEVIFNGPWWWEATTLRHTLTLPEIMRGQRNERLGEPAALIALWALHLRLNEVVRIASGCVLRSAQRWGK